MSLEYTNRKGDRYYVLQGRTKTGKPKYYCSRKSDGQRVEALPSNFEIYEHPVSALVSVRKVKPSRLLPAEAEFLKEQVRKLSGLEYFIVDHDADSLIVYVCDRAPDAVNDLLERLMGPLGDHAEANRQWIAAHAPYSPMFRFTLANEEERLFHLERWYYRGSIDDWIHIMVPPGPLDELAEEFLPHLGQESFFELM
jgi:hypothetical protein